MLREGVSPFGWSEVRPIKPHALPGNEHGCTEVIVGRSCRAARIVRTLGKSKAAKNGKSREV